MWAVATHLVLTLFINVGSGYTLSVTLFINVGSGYTPSVNPLY